MSMLTRRTQRRYQSLSQTQISVDFVMTYDAVTEVGAPPPVHEVTLWQGRQIVNLLDDASVRRECAGSTREQRVRMIFEELEESVDAL